MTKGSVVKTDDVKYRLDKWIWAARFFKTRALATEAASKGRVKVNGALAKPGREVRLGDSIEMLVQQSTWTVKVLALSNVRGSATIAQALYKEDAESLKRRLDAQDSRKLTPEPAETIRDGRPPKRNRRDLETARGRQDG
ncbi:MAG: RNA-binding S4 domain-containing protein, partial [Burkholderiaceae bacterium]